MNFENLLLNGEEYASDQVLLLRSYICDLFIVISTNIDLFYHEREILYSSRLSV